MKPICVRSISQQRSIFEIDFEYGSVKLDRIPWFWRRGSLRLGGDAPRSVALTHGRDGWSGRYNAEVVQLGGLP